MSKSLPSLSVSLLLKPEHRNRQGREQTEKICQQLDLVVTSASDTALCLEVPVERFKSLFGVLPKLLKKRGIGKSDFGAPAGYADAESLTVPDQLKPLIEMAAIEPPATRLQ